MINVKEHLAAVVGVVGMVIGAIAWFDARYMHKNDIVIRDLMSQSRNYAQVEKYYTDALLEGVELSESQKARLKLVQDEQERISGILLEEKVEEN